MIVAGIIAEYNPFHRGHRLHIDATRAMGATHIAVVMSGNFTQRGGIAAFDKSLRALAALKGGADLVIELPVPYSLATAQRFADAGVQILNGLGAVDILSFGSESGKIEDVKMAAAAVSDGRVREKMREKLKEGLAFAQARCEAIRDVFGDRAAEIVSLPNDTLGVEYVSAIVKSSSKITPMAVERVGAGHDSSESAGSFASASYIRDKIYKGELDGVRRFLTDDSYELMKSAVSCGDGPAGMKKLEISMLSHLRRLSVDDIAGLPDVSEGLDAALDCAIRSTCTVDGLLNQVKTKRYALSRIRRIIWSAYLGIDAATANGAVPYIRVLGLNDRGREILKAAKKTSLLPIVMRSRDIMELNETSRKIFKLECMATDIFSLSTPVTGVCGAEQRRNVVIV